MAYVLTKVSDNFSSLSASEKETLFDTYEQASSTELQTLGKAKVVAYSSENNSVFSKVVVHAVPNDLLILPKTLFGDSFDKIRKVSITELISDNANADIRYIVTKDLITYYTFKSSVWEQLTDVSASNVLTNGMTSSTLQNIDVDTWSKFYDSKEDFDGIGIGFAIKETSTTQTTEVDNMSVEVDIRGMWMKAEHKVDYNYGYAGNKSLRVKLLTDGSYKINYSQS